MHVRGVHSGLTSRTSEAMEQLVTGMHQRFYPFSYQIVSVLHFRLSWPDPLFIVTVHGFPQMGVREQKEDNHRDQDQERRQEHEGEQNATQPEGDILTLNKAAGHEIE